MRSSSRTRSGNYQSLQGLVKQSDAGGIQPIQRFPIGDDGIGDDGEQSLLRGRLRQWWPFRGSSETGLPEDQFREGGDQPGHQSQELVLGPSFSPQSGASCDVHQLSSQAPEVDASISHALPHMSSGSNPDLVDAATWPANGDQRWMPDEKALVCFHCSQAFTVVRRRHHCRLCGQIFCRACSSHFVAGKLIGRPREQLSRLCGPCTKHCDGLPLSARQDRAHRAPFFGGRRSLSRTSEESTPTATQLDSGNTSDSTPVASSSAHTPSASSAASETGDETPVARRNTRRLSEATMSAVPEEGEGSDDLGLRSSGSDEEDDEESLSDFGEDTLEGGSNRSGIRATSSWPTDDASDDELIQMESPAANTEKFLPKAPLMLRTETGLPAAAKQHVASMSHEAFDQPADMLEQRHSDTQIMDEAVKYFTRSVRECCRRVGGGLEDPTHILSICELARQVVDHIEPVPDDCMDILAYVKVKRIPGGSITDSQWVDGVVFSRDLAHRKMRTGMHDCTLALLGDSLSFDHNNRLTPLEMLCKQEENYFKLKVDKIADLQPQLLLCQGGVSQIAQEKLRSKNISLILGVPPHILQAVARCTEAKVLKSVDSILVMGDCRGDRAARLVGNCRYFGVQHTGDVGSKPLAVIEASKQNRCCTVCLRGGGNSPAEEALELLGNAKRVLQWAVRLARHLQLESELLRETRCEARPRTAAHSAEVVTRSFPLGTERLDVISYSVSHKDRCCTRPWVMCLEPYVPTVPSMPLQPPKKGVKGVNWAGGLEDGEEVQVRDCTLREWLNRCFMPGQQPAEEQAPQAACFPTPSQRAATLSSAHLRIPHDDSSAASSVTGSVVSAVPPLAQPVSSSSTSSVSGSTRISSESAVLDTSNAARRAVPVPVEPPVPSKNEVLCFQHLGSRVVAEICDKMDPASRNRAFSDVHPEDPADATGEHMSPGGLHPHQANVASNRRQKPIFKVRRWCNLCNNGQGAMITRWLEVSDSASWLSFTKFLEMLMHDGTSVLSSGGSSSGEQKEVCPHAAFRNEKVLFFDCPQRPIAIGFTWEPVNPWQLQQPNLPLWDPVTLCFLPPPPEMAVSEDNTEKSMNNYKDNHKNLHRLISVLVHDIGTLVSCALTALTEADEEPLPPPRSGYDSLVPSPLLPHASVSATSLRDRSESQPDSPVSSIFSKPSVSKVGAAPLPLSTGLPPWLKGWVSENKTRWHLLISNLTRMQAALRNCLMAADSHLHACRQREGGEVDPILLAYTQRELIDALRLELPFQQASNSREVSSGSSRPAQNGAGTSDKPLTVSSASAELSSMLKMKSAPRDEAEERRNSFGVRGSLSELALGFPKDHFKRIAAMFPWGQAPEDQVQPPPLPPPPSFPDLKRSRSTRRSPRQRRRIEIKKDTMKTSMVRSSSAEGLHAQISGLQGNANDRRLEDDRQSNYREISNLPEQMRKVQKGLEQAAAEEETFRKALLDRGVYRLSVPVHEEDVGSIIAHALLSNQVHEAMASQWPAFTGGRHNCCPLAGKSGECGCFFSLPSSLRRAPGEAPQQPASGPIATASAAQMQPSAASTGDAQHKLEKLLEKLSKLELLKPYDVPTTPRHHWEHEWEQLGVRKVLNAATPAQPIRVEFTDPSMAKYSVTIHHAPQFHILRHWLCGDDLNFVRSLHTCNRITPTGGKSGAAFFVTNDKRFLLKAVNRQESRLLTTQGEALFWYADQVLFDKLPSVLALVVGVFTVSVTVSRRSGKAKQWKKTFIVQRNLRYNLMSRSHSCFDLKGVGRSRRFQRPEDVDDDEKINPNASGSGFGVAGSSVATASTANHLISPTRSTYESNTTRAVLWDQNFREWTEGKPLSLVSRDLKYLEAAIKNDTQLLSGSHLSLLDYSLLLAAAPQEGADGVNGSAAAAGGTLAVGIIDYLRPFTWDKQFETMGKSAYQAVKGLGHRTADQPTVIEPVEYARRFEKAMSTFFVAQTPPRQ